MYRIQMYESLWNNAVTSRIYTISKISLESFLYFSVQKIVFNIGLDLIFFNIVIFYNSI